MEFSNEVINLVGEAEIALKETFEEIDRISFKNTQKVMNAFANHRVSESVSLGT